MKILALASTFPYPPTRGGTEVRTFNLLKYLQRHHQVTVLAQRDRAVSEADIDGLKSYVSDVVLFPEPPDPEPGLVPKATRFLESLLTATPANVWHHYCPQMQAWIDRCVDSGECDAITSEHSINEIFIRPQYRQKVRTVVNVHSSLCGWTRSHLESGITENIWRDRLYLNLILERYERRYPRKFDALVATTPEDGEQFRAIAPDADIRVVPNGVDLESFPMRDRDPGGYELAFVGAMDGPHNIDAARFFATEVLPHLQQRYPQAQFTIVGARPTPEVLALGDRPGVTVTGKVPSMVDYLHRAVACVVPLRAGYGIKNKTLEAMAAGVPTVASDRGLEGLSLPPDTTVSLRANSIAEYLEAIGRVFEDASLRAELSRNGRNLVETVYTWERAGECYERAIAPNALRQLKIQN